MRAPVRIVLLAAALTLGGCGTTSAVQQPAVQQPAAEQPGAAAAGAPSTPVAAPATGASGSGTGAATGASVAGAYLSQEEYQAQRAARAGTRVVLFFHAPWCSDCRATEKSLTSAGVPAGLTVVKVDYDSAQALRQQYGVTVQHTFVQVAPDGAPMAKFTGSISGADILVQTV